MPGWASIGQIVKDEIEQRQQEGYITETLAKKWEDYSQLSEGQDESMYALYEMLGELDMRKDWAYSEPSSYDEIEAESGGAGPCLSVPARNELKDRLKGAWLGRICGCMLGKPVEGWTECDISKWLTAVGEYPLNDYIPFKSEDTLKYTGKRPCPDSSRGAWKHAMWDDDTNYTYLSMKIFESKGPGFTTEDVGKAWLDYLPYHSVFTAERQAYMNLVNDMTLEEAGEYMNPYREWIGAQIRADFWGYVAPGDVKTAARYAHRDAVLSHRKNGIYGEMFCAAAISAALCTDDIHKIIDAGLSVVPKKCRLAETVADCLSWKEEYATWEAAFEAMTGTYYGKYNWVHTNNNLAVVLIALLFGWPDFGKIVTYAVMMGLDTDCNGATAGSIAGAALGAKRLPEKWIKPVGGKLDTTIAGSATVAIDELVDRTLKCVDMRD